MVIESTSRGAVRRLEMIVAGVLAVRVPGKSRILYVFKVAYRICQ